MNFKKSVLLMSVFLLAYEASASSELATSNNPSYSGMAVGDDSLSTLDTPLFALSGYALHLDQPDFQVNVKKIPVATASEALRKISEPSFSEKDDLRYWDADQVQNALKFQLGGGCSLGNCIPFLIKYDLEVVEKDRTSTVVAEQYTGKDKMNLLVDRLNTIFKEAKIRGVGVMLQLDELSDNENVLFVK